MYKNMFYAVNVITHNSIFDIFIEFCVCSFLHIYNWHKYVNMYLRFSSQFKCSRKYNTKVILTITQIKRLKYIMRNILKFH